VKMVKNNHFFRLAWVKLIIAVDSDNQDLLDFLCIHTRILGFFHSHLFLILTA